MDLINIRMTIGDPVMVKMALSLIETAVVDIRTVIENNRSILQVAELWTLRKKISPAPSTSL